MEARSHLRNRDENRIYLKVWHWVNLSNSKNSVFISAVIMSMSDRITLKKSIDFIILKKNPPHLPSMGKSEFIVTDLCALINQ